VLCEIDFPLKNFVLIPLSRLCGD